MSNPEYNEYTLSNGMTVKIDSATEKEYKQSAEYMMKSMEYADAQLKNKDFSSDEQTMLFAIEGLKAGLDPKELSEEELKRKSEALFEEYLTTLDKVGRGRCRC